MIDQEQTERGASMGLKSAHVHSFACDGCCTDLIEERDRLRADLERVTAELAKTDQILRNNQLRREEVEMRHGDLLRANRALEAERDAMREVCSNVIGPHISDKMHNPRDCQRCKFNHGVAVVLDATRKATAEALEAEIERLRMLGQTFVEELSAALVESRATEAELRRQRDGYFAALNSIAASYCESGRATYHSHIAKDALDAAEQPARAEGGQG